jgi:hypothetical protein
MRIQDLLEGTLFKDEDFVTPREEGGREINFDLPDDLIHFMNHDDHVYRRHLFPVIARVLDLHKKKITPKPSIFKPAVEDSYKIYIKKFPIRELPDDIEEDTCKKVCDKMHEEVCQHISDGKYKD